MEEPNILDTIISANEQVKQTGIDKTVCTLNIEDYNKLLLLNDIKPEPINGTLFVYGILIQHSPFMEKGVFTLSEIKPDIL